MLERLEGCGPTGEPPTFDAVVEAYQGKIARYIFRLVGDTELAMDLTQDTFVNAYRHFHALRSPLALSAWLYRIATNLAVQARWRGSRMKLQALYNLENSRTAATDAPDTGVIDREMVHLALAQLPRDRAACLLLHVKEGFSYEEVAMIMGISPEAARKRIARAKTQFRALYDESMQDGPLPGQVHDAVRTV